MEDHLRGDSWYIILKTDYFTSDFLRQCKHNPNILQEISKDTKNIIKQIYLEGELYSQIAKIYHYIQKTKVTKENLVKEKYQNNENENNTQNEDENDTDTVLVKDKYNTQPSESTGDTPKKEKSSSEESEPQYHFQVQSTRLQHWFDLDSGWIEDTLMTRETGFSKCFTLNVFYFLKIRIVFRFLFQ